MNTLPQRWGSLILNMGALDLKMGASPLNIGTLSRKLE